MAQTLSKLDSIFGAGGVLVVAHPGHELRIHGFLERYRPVVNVITDGSQRSGRSRLSSTDRVLRAAGCRPGPVYGRLSDAEIYEVLLQRDVERLIDIALDIAAELVNPHAAWVAGDAIECYNPAHDVCNAIMRCAVSLAQQRAARPISCFEFPLVGSPSGDSTFALRGDAVGLLLDDAAYARKLSAARAYPELADEVDAQLAAVGENPFREEWMWPLRVSSDDAPPVEPPFYETHGAERVSEGHYRRVITYREHLAPINAELRARSEAGVT